MNEIPRRTLAPFVGAALAALTAGSLVVFSLVAQRTSLDGFPERRAAAPVDVVDETPASITIDPADAAGSSGGSEPSPASITPSLPLVEIADTTPSAASGEVALVDTAPGEVALVDTAPATAPERADTSDPDARLRAEGVLLANRSGGGHPDGDARGRSEAAGNDERHSGKHGHKSHEVKGKKSKGKGKSKGKSNGKKKSEGAGKAARSSRSGGAHGHRGPPPHAGRPHDNGGGPPAHAGGSSGRSGSAKPSSGGSPPAHSNAGGSGRSRGKGHKKH